MNTFSKFNITKALKGMLAAAMLFTATDVLAEGSKDWYPQGATGHRAHLLGAGYTSTEAIPFPNRGAHYVYAREGETITLASSVQGYGGNNSDRWQNRNKISLFGPSGNSISLQTSTGSQNSNTIYGHISGRSAELAGPQFQNAATNPTNTYRPIYYTVPAGGDGVYRVEFEARTTTGNGSWADVTALWSQPNDATVVAWDISVINKTDDGFVSGRVYATNLNLSTGNGSGSYADIKFNGVIYTRTADGYTYRTKHNGSNGIVFTFFVNNRGFYDIINNQTVLLYKSLNSQASGVVNRIHNPNTVDREGNITHKMFYNYPDTGMPSVATASIGVSNAAALSTEAPSSVNTWLNVNPIVPDVQNVKVIGTEGTQGQMGSKGGSIEFYAPVAAQYRMVIQSPNAGFVTKIFTGQAVQGQNAVIWDGKDGAGNPAPSGEVPLSVKVVLQGAEVHFPFFDVEYNIGGITIELLGTNNPQNVITDRVFWDDSLLPTSGFSGSAATPVNNSHILHNNGVFNIGQPSKTNGHNFATGAATTGAGTYGDMKAIDTWTFVQGEEALISAGIAIKESDLEVTSVIPDKVAVTAGESLNYTVKVRNNGPSDVTGAKFTFILPLGFNHQDVVFSGNNCGSQQLAITYDAATRTYSSLLNLPDQCEVTYTFTVTAQTGTIPGNQVFEAAILRPNDVTDPDATNPDPLVKPIDAHFECQNNGLGGVCNNILSNTAVIFQANYCVTGNCNPNTYVNSMDPNTLEYDNMVGLFHSSMVKEADGKIKVWGQGTQHNGTGQSGNYLVPMEVNSTNYPLLTGDVLKFAGASNVQTQQFAVLTTTGLFSWSNSGVLVPTALQAAGSFTKLQVGTYGIAGTKADGLPNGVQPTDVKMMFGSNNVLAVVTCTGEAWILSTNGNLYGDGVQDNTANDIVWHRVATADAGNPELTNVVAVRGTLNGLMALTGTGDIFTWGTSVRLGDGTAPSNRNRATKMTLPGGVIPKMIGMTRSNNGLTNYVLTTNGDLYGLGENGSRQLGNTVASTTNSWVSITASSGTNSLGGNIVWISPQEHEGGNYPAINVLTNNGKLWAWGGNNGNMIGGTATTLVPTFMPGSITTAYNAEKLNLSDTLIAVETGGHTTLTIKQCSTKFGYVGHRTNGSMANGSTLSGNDSDYNFGETAELSICGALTGPVVKDLTICQGTQADLKDAEPVALPTGAGSIQWWTTIDRLPGTEVPNPSSVEPGTYYAFYNPLIVTCPTTMTVRYRVETDPDYSECSSELITNPMVRQRLTN